MNPNIQAQFITTEDFAALFCRKPQTVRKNFCLTGECFGVRPRKIAGRLLWPLDDAQAILSGEKLSKEAA